MGGKRGTVVVLLVAMVAGLLVGADPVAAADGEAVDWVSIAQKAIMVLVQLTIPPLLAFALAEFKRWQAERADQGWYRVLQDIVRDAVAAAEQLGLTEELAEVGQTKLDYAIAYVERSLRAHGFPIDLAPYVDVIRGMIEAEVQRQYPKRPAA